MLDLSHPHSQYVFQASAILSGLLSAGQSMSVADSAYRNDLLPKCLEWLDQLDQLAQSHFQEDYETISDGIESFRTGLTILAGLGNGAIEEDRRDGVGDCPACGKPITSYTEFHIVLCDHCCELFMSAYGDLCGFSAFGTDAI